MEVDHPAAVHLDPSAEGSVQKGDGSPDVQVDIEQRWYQVETTPLRENKQVPITSTPGNPVNSDRLPPHELAALLDKEVGIQITFTCNKSACHVIKCKQLLEMPLITVVALRCNGSYHRLSYKVALGSANMV